MAVGTAIGIREFVGIGQLGTHCSPLGLSILKNKCLDLVVKIEVLSTLGLKFDPLLPCLIVSKRTSNLGWKECMPRAIETMVNQNLRFFIMNKYVCHRDVVLSILSTD